MKPPKPIVSYMSALYATSQNQQTAADSLHAVVSDQPLHVFWLVGNIR
jgi:hypothetical protein